MTSRIRYGFLISLVVVSLIVISFNTSHAETINYIYDGLNRLIRVEYADGTKIDYTYDQAGNRSQVYVGKYTLAVNVVGSGTVTKNPDQPIYSAGASVTLTAVNGSQTFSEWSGDLTGNTNPTTIVMDGNKSVTATFVTQGWLQGWAYRKPVTLSRASGSVTNYQMRLLVGETSGASGEDVDCNGHVLSNFNDLRFTKSDGAIVLDYWIESITGTTPNRLATVWIEFDSIGAGATTFYMYYGKADALAASNGEATFLFFDDFPGSSLNGSKWTVIQGDVAVSSSELILTGTTGTRGIIDTAALSGVGCAIRARVKGNYNSMRNIHFANLRVDANNTVDLYGTINNAELILYTAAAGTWSQDILSVASLNTYRIYDLTWLSGQAKVIQDGVIKDTKTTNIPSSGSAAIRFVEGNSSGVNGHIDWILLRKLGSTEPAWGSWGAEQTN